MRLLNKNSAFGCLFGGFASPLLIVGGIYLLVQLADSHPGDMSFGPPYLPIQDGASLDWKVQRLDGTELSLRDVAQNQPLFLNFWATWCVPCVTEMPQIQRLYEAFEGRVAFACVSDEDLATISAFRDAVQYTVRMYHIEGDPPQEFQRDGVPVTYLISREERVILRHLGGADWTHESVVEFLERLLSDDGAG